jgi:hypothetical protein
MEMDEKNTQNNELLKKKILGFRRVTGHKGIKLKKIKNNA